jgi:hypothetical protein
VDLQSIAAVSSEERQRKLRYCNSSDSLHSIIIEGFNQSFVKGFVNGTGINHDEKWTTHYVQRSVSTKHLSDLCGMVIFRI